MEEIRFHGLRKNKMKGLLIIFSVVANFSFAFSQRINGFNLYPVSNGINVNFNIGPGPDCYGYKIYHCLDSVSYVEIYDFPSICGTSTSNEFKSYTHENPGLNQINYYKIQLYPYEVAYNRILYTNDGKGKVLAYPNPVSQRNLILNLKVLGVDNSSVEGYICNEFGVKLQAIDARTQGDLLQIDISGYSDGIFMVWFSDGSRIFTTKFIVLHTN